jgi:two-component system OmpR family sensor kinase
MKPGLRLRVTLWSLAANGLFLTAGTFFLFWLLDQQLTGALDEALAVQARATAGLIEAWVVAELKQTAKTSSANNVAGLLASDSKRAGLQDLFTPPRDVPANLSTMTSLLDSEGQVVLSTHAPNAMDVPDESVLRVVRSGRIHQALVTVTDSQDQEKEFRVATAPVTIGGQVDAFVQVLGPLQALRSTLIRVQTVLVFCVVVLMGLNGWLVALALKRAFQPVDRLVADIHRISEKNLSVRVPIPATQDEIRRLGETFNAMLERLDRGFQFQSRLFQDLSHQLRTPLAILTGTLETALHQARTVEEYRSILESNLDEVSRVTQLIESLLLLARLDSQQMELNTERIDLGDFCRRWVEDFSLLFGSRELTPVWKQDSPLPVSLDEARLGQALLNLLDNAVKHSPVGGFITFHLYRSQNMAVLDLINQGPSFVPGTEESIFQRFYTATDGKPGFGLGLPIARAAAELHGGTLSAFTPAHQGAGFRLSLPLLVAERSLISN